MSERFSDEVLQRVLDANEKAFWAKRDEEGLYAPDANAVAAGHAAMRKVLEGHEHEEVARLRVALEKVMKCDAREVFDIAHTALEGHLAAQLAASRQFGAWPEHCEQRAFVDGAKWWEFRKTGGTMWAQDVSIAEYVAVERYGEPGASSDGTGQPKQDPKALCRCGCTFEQHDDPTQFRPAISTGAAS